MRKQIVIGLLSCCLICGAGACAFSIINANEINVSTTDDVIEKYFKGAKLSEREELTDGSVELVYEKDDYLIRTTENRKKVIHVMLSPEAANKPEGSKVDSEIIKEMAIKQLEVFLDHKYDWDVNVTSYTDLYQVSVIEKHDGLETGAKGYFTYMGDGRCLDYSFTNRVVDSPADEKIISEEEAIKAAIAGLEKERPELERISLDEERAVKLTTAYEGQVYQVPLTAYKRGESAEYPSSRVACSLGVSATTGEVLVYAYSDM